MQQVNNSSFKPAPNGFCVLCATKTSLACHRCGDFYCSKECQLGDWQRHRYICFSIPALVHPNACSVFCAEELPPAPQASRQAEAAQSVSVTAQKTNINGQGKQDKQSTIQLEVSGSAKPTLVAAAAFAAAHAPVAAAAAAPAAITECEQKNKSVAISENESNKNNNNSLNISTSKKINSKAICPPFAVMPPIHSVVYITGFRSPNRCFVRDASETAEKAFLSICEKVNAVGKEQPLLHNPAIYSFALAKYNGLFHRVQVIAMRPNHSSRLLYLDQGIIKPQNGVELRSISSELLELPCYSLQVALKDVPNYALVNEITDFLTQFEGDKFILAYNEFARVELLSAKTQQSVNAKIRDFCSNMQVFDKQSKHGKTVAPQAKKAETIAPIVPECLKIAEVKPETNSSAEQNSSTKRAALDKAIQLMLDKDQTAVASHEQLAKKEQLTKAADMKLFIDSTSRGNEMEHIKKAAMYIKAVTEVNHKANVPNSTKVQMNLNSNLNSVSQENNLPKGPPEKIKPYDYTKLIEIAIETQKTPTTKPDLNAVNNKENLPNEPPAKMQPFDYTKTIEAPKETKPDLNFAAPSIGNKMPNTPNNTPKPNVEPVLIPPFPMERFNTNAMGGLDVFIVDTANVSLGIFGAFDSAYARNFSDLHSRLSEFKDSQPYRPVLKEYVIAKFEDAWYRAIVMNIKKNQDEYLYNVMYIEFTNAATITEQDIRRYPTDLTIPCYTSVCLIEGFPHRPSKAQTAYLEAHLQMHSLLHIDSVSYQHEMAQVKCKSLIEELHKNKNL